MKHITMRIFRFNSKTDYEYYYKPYKVSFNQIGDDFCLFDVLKIIKNQDRYFTLPSEDEFVRISNKVLSLKTNFKEILETFGDEIYVSVLDLKRATLDLNYDDSDFLDIFKYFKNFCDDEDFANYTRNKFLYYASDVRAYNEDFLGDSAFVFAKYLIDKYPNKKDDILKIVFNKDYGIEYAVNLEPFLYKDYEKYEEIKNELKSQRKNYANFNK